jgi:hypothetical protein
MAVYEWQGVVLKRVCRIQTFAMKAYLLGVRSVLAEWVIGVRGS